MDLPWSHTRYKYVTTTALHTLGMTAHRTSPALRNYILQAQMQTLSKAPFSFPTTCFRGKASDGLRISIIYPIPLYDEMSKSQQIILAKVK